MNRYLLAVVASVAIAFSPSALAAPIVTQGGYELAPQATLPLPTQDCAGLFPTNDTQDAVGGGDAVGSLPLASTQILRTSWTCKCHGWLQEIETKPEIGDSAEATSKKHDYQCDARAKNHPSADPVVGASSHPAPGGPPYDTTWRYIQVGGVNGDEYGFAKAHVHTEQYLNEPAWLTQKKHLRTCVALAVLQPPIE